MDGPSTWAEIDSILASINPNRASWISQLEAAAAAVTGAGGDRLLVGLDDWAALNRLEEEILAALLAHGFDCAGFINGVLSDTDLEELGVRSAAQRRRILTAVQDLPNCALEVAESLQGSASLDCLLQRLRLNRQQLGREFAAGAALTTVDDLTSVTDAELQLRFGVHKLGHRRRIICCLDNARALGRLRRAQQQQLLPSSTYSMLPGAGQNGIQHARQNSNLSTRSASSSTATASATAAAAQPSVSSSCAASSSSEDDEDRSSMLAAASAGIANRRPGVRTAATAVSAAIAAKNSSANTATLTEVLPRREMPPFPAGVSRSWVATSAGDEVRRGQDLSGEKAATRGAADSAGDAVLARSRSIDCLDGGGAGQQRRFGFAAFRPLVSECWPHHPDVLLRDSFSYSVSYLGFRPLADHTDPAETAQVMLMFRCKSADILKLPRIRLTVCYRGVKFINPDNDMVITEHRITEIYFACQDNTRRANFAYVTKDSVNSVHFCHCFASHSPETAVLIIQTLSEACGLANQLIEFNQLRRQQLQPADRRRSDRKRNRRS